MEDYEKDISVTAEDGRVSNHSILNDSMNPPANDIASSIETIDSPQNEGLPHQPDRTFKARHIQMMSLGIILPFTTKLTATRCFNMIRIALSIGDSAGISWSSVPSSCLHLHENGSLFSACIHLQLLNIDFCR